MAADARLPLPITAVCCFPSRASQGETFCLARGCSEQYWLALCGSFWTKAFGGSVQQAQTSYTANTVAQTLVSGIFLYFPYHWCVFLCKQLNLSCPLMLIGDLRPTPDKTSTFFFFFKAISVNNQYFERSLWGGPFISKSLAAFGWLQEKGNFGF